MIVPKHSFGEEKFRERFVDRNEAKRVFFEKQNENKSDYNVLVYYGVGGVGKTKLREELIKINNSKSLNKSFYLDFNSPDDRNIASALLKLSNSIGKGVDFRNFSSAYTIYYCKKHPGSSFNKTDFSTEDNIFIKTGLNILSIFDNGITVSIAQFLDRFVDLVKRANIDKEVKEFLKGFSSYSIEKMEEYLPLFFSYDLKKYFEKNKEAKCIIVFDTLEALNENVLEESHRMRNVKWLQDFISYFPSFDFPNLTFLLFGRDKLNWGKEWNEYLFQYELKGFDDNYSEEYLSSLGIQEDNIRKTILENSKGFPLLLSLQAQTYLSIVTSGKIPKEEDFKGERKDIVGRFLYNLDKESSSMLKLLSYTRTYNDDLFLFLAKKFNISFTSVDIEQFNKYSFVQCDKKEDLYSIHSVVAEEIRNFQSQNIQKDIYKSLFQFYTESFCSSPSIQLLFEMFYFAEEVYVLEDFSIWLEKNMFIKKEEYSPLEILLFLQKKGEQNVLSIIFEVNLQNHYV